MRQEIEFTGAHGTTLRGWLYLPDGASADAPVPGVVLASGASATRHMHLGEFAEVFCDAGFAAVAYDHRNLGDSDGEPRQLLNPWAQARDYRYAITFLSDRPEVDASRIAVWGSSFSGGHALTVGCIDDRVKAVTIGVPFCFLPDTDYSDSTLVKERVEGVRAGIEDETGAGPADDTSAFVYGPMAVVPDEVGGAGFFPQAESVAWFEKWKSLPASKWVNEISVQGVDVLPPYDPGACAVALGKPLLMVVATEERLLDAAAIDAVFDLVPEPKRRVAVEGDHFAPYQGEGFLQASAAMRDFLLEHL